MTRSELPYLCGNNRGYATCPGSKHKDYCTSCMEKDKRLIDLIEQNELLEYKDGLRKRARWAYLETKYG